MAWKPDYITVADAKAYLRIGDAADDAELGLLVTAASRAIDNRCNRQFGQEAAPVARVYRRAPSFDPVSGLWLLEIDDVMTTTGLTVNGVSLAASGGTLLPDNAAANGKPWERIGFTSQPAASAPGAPVLNTIVARYGWTAYPSQVPAAVRLQVSRWNARRDSPYGIAGSAGAEMRLLARLDPDVGTSLAGLQRRRAIG